MINHNLIQSLCKRYDVELSDKYVAPMIRNGETIRPITADDILTIVQIKKENEVIIMTEQQKVDETEQLYDTLVNQFYMNNFEPIDYKPSDKAAVITITPVSNSPKIITLSDADFFLVNDPYNIICSRENLRDLVGNLMDYGDRLNQWIDAAKTLKQEYDQYKNDINALNDCLYSDRHKYLFGYRPKETFGSRHTQRLIDLGIIEKEQKIFTHYESELEIEQQQELEYGE